MNIYLDNAATAKQHPAAAQEVAYANENLFYNSAALYKPSLTVKNEIARAGEIIKRRLARTGGGEITFTSGATESNNIVILGKVTRKAMGGQSGGHHLLVLEGEHSSVYAPAKYLRDNGFDVGFVPLNRDGTCDLTALRRLVRHDTALFVFGLVNSDTGCIQNAAEIVRVVRDRNRGVHIHCDATQGFAKIPFDAVALGIDSVAISAHKIGGPKGVGVLWFSSKLSTIKPLMHGGGQQFLRPGTENTPAILGFAKAAEVWDTDVNLAKASQLHERLIRGLPAGCTVNGINNNPYITNIQLPSGVLGQTVMNALAVVGICVGLGSACASAAVKNRTLLAMGIAEARTKQVLRVSFGINNTSQDVDTFLAELKKVLGELR